MCAAGAQQHILQKRKLLVERFDDVFLAPISNSRLINTRHVGKIKFRSRWQYMTGKSTVHLHEKNYFNGFVAFIISSHVYCYGIAFSLKVIYEFVVKVEG